MATSTKKRKFSEDTDVSCIGNTNQGGGQNDSQIVDRPEAFQSVQQDDPLYSMTGEKKGIAIIIKMENYANPKQNRIGASNDAKKCKDTFEYLKFEVIEFSDLGKDELLMELDNIRSTQLDNFDSLVVVYMGHGRKDEDTGKEYILLSDHKEVLISELWKPFSADKCPAMAGQPKLFFIQVCRGKIKEHGIALKRWSDWETDIISEPDEYVIPLHSDMLMMWASYPDMPAHRNFSPSYGIQGSVFIHYLCQVLQSDSKREDLLSMLLTVTRKVGILYETKEGVKQLPYLSSTLMRKVVFSDGLRKLHEWISTDDKSAKLMKMVSANE